MSNSLSLNESAAAAAICNRRVVIAGGSGVPRPVNCHPPEQSRGRSGHPGSQQPACRAVATRLLGRAYGGCMGELS